MSKKAALFFAIVAIVIAVSPAYAAGPQDPPRSSQPAAADIAGEPVVAREGSDQSQGQQVQAGPNGPAYRPNQPIEIVEPVEPTTTSISTSTYASGKRTVRPIHGAMDTPYDGGGW